MKTIFFALLLSIFSFTTFAQSPKLSGSWLMTQAKTGDRIEEPYFITDYNDDGTMTVMGIEAGSWNQTGNEITMHSTLDKDFNGKATILTLTKNKLVIQKEGAVLSYIKVFPEEIAKANSSSLLIGTWKIATDESTTKLLKFNAPDDFILVNASGGMTETTHGTWMYSAKDKTLILMGISLEIRGKLSIKTLNENNLVLVNKNETINAEKINDSSSAIERLTFNYEDFPEDEDNEAKLPWPDFYEMVMNLNNIEYLKFRWGNLMEEMNTFEYSSTVSIIEVDKENPMVMFTNLKVSQSDTSQFSQTYKDDLHNAYNPFFPQEEPWPYRVLNTETITVPAGTFECSVVEGFEGETKVKYWMINNKPGVYAKIITEDISPFDELEYRVIELEEIK